MWMGFEDVLHIRCLQGVNVSSDRPDVNACGGILAPWD